MYDMFQNKLNFEQFSFYNIVLPEKMYPGLIYYFKVGLKAKHRLYPILGKAALTATNAEPNFSKAMVRGFNLERRLGNQNYVHIVGGN